MKKLTLNEVKELLEGSGYFGFRGLSGIHGQVEYQEGEILDCSIDDWDNREIEYKPDLPRLNGTSAIGISYFMEDDELIKMYQRALKYSDCGKVVLINGDRETFGADQYEAVISYVGDGAKFLGYVEL